MNVLLDQRQHQIASSKLDCWAERRDAFIELEPWINGGLVLQKAEGSAMHRMRQVGAVYMLAPEYAEAWIEFPGEDHQTQIFVVQHNWAAAFDGATDFADGDFSLPFDSCCFEFRISGKRVCALVTEKETGKEIVTLVETARCWAVPVTIFSLSEGKWKPDYADLDNSFEALPAFMAAHIRAICISLEAEVAAAETVHRPEKVNAARVRRGKEPLPDYNVIHLNRRPRSVTLPGEEGAYKKRLHFRRGHWRHLSSERKTWVKWCLVGDPDLGFIEKEYRL